MKLLLLLSALFFYAVSFGNVDTIQVFSNSMQKNVKCVVVTPKSYKKADKKFPVVYLLHGYAGDYSNWITKVPVIDSLADDYQMIIICPDAAFSSWYFDSPVDTSFKYETFTSIELPNFIDANYKTIQSRKARAITGLSMGGHGAIFLSFRHPDVFGACGSMSGILDLNQFITRFDIIKRLGDTLINRHYYTELGAAAQFDKYSPADSLTIIVDCGTSDFSYHANRLAHEKMLKLKIPHDYIERPGTHDWKYWGNAVKYQLLFFREYFNRNK